MIFARRVAVLLAALAAAAALTAPPATADPTTAAACAEGVWCGGGSAYRAADYKNTSGVVLFTAYIDTQVKRQGSLTWLRAYMRVQQRSTSVANVQAGSTDGSNRVRMGSSVPGSLAVRTCPTVNDPTQAITWSSALEVDEVPSGQGYAYRTIGEASARLHNGALLKMPVVGGWTSYSFLT